jgi:elongation factor 2 kinase
VQGEYVKYSNNDGWSEDRRNTPHAFSHFTYEASGRSLVVCDIQGAPCAARDVLAR